MNRILTIALLIIFVSCQISQKEKDRLGVVYLEVSGNKEAREHFEKGLLLLHSFEYTDAREAFEAAITADPDMAMAYWGKAMTYNHSIWFEQDYEAASACLQAMNSRKNLKMNSDLEENFIQAVQMLYEAGKPKNQRDQKYAEFLGVLHDKYPRNQEVAAFYSLSLLGTISEGRDYEVYGEAAKIARKVLKVNPKHPGALHYLIHSYDDPDHARLALDAADAYAVVAPDAAHALHMPSHIYVAMGMWDKVVASNEESYGASINRMERKSLNNDARGYHSYHWLQYGYLQQGRDEEAKNMALELQKYIEETPSRRGRSHMVFLKGTFLSETDQWDSPVADIPVQVADLNIVVQAQYATINGIKAYRSGDADGLTDVIGKLEKRVQEEEIKVDNQEKGFVACTNLSRETANRTDLDLARVMTLQMKGLRSWMESDQEHAEYYLKLAADTEDQLTYSYGPPVVQKPTHELYADWLLAQGRIEDALEEYQLTLKKAPKRTRALKGVIRTSELLNNRELTLETKAQLKEQTTEIAMSAVFH